MAGVRKSKRRHSKLRNKTRRQRGGGGGYSLSPEEKKRIMDRVAGIPSYNTYRAAEAQKPWYLKKSDDVGGGEIAPPVQPVTQPVNKPWWKKLVGWPIKN